MRDLIICIPRYAG